MPSNVQIHRQAQLHDTNILMEAKISQYNLLQKHDTIIPNSDNVIGQTDLIEMHIATRPDAAPITA